MKTFDPTPPKTLNEFGYTLLQREPGRVEVWLDRDDTLKFVTTDFLRAFQFAYFNPHGLIPPSSDGGPDFRSPRQDPDQSATGSKPVWTD